MVRQCAWCLRLINSQGEQISTFPLPKLYVATHGMCQNCGLLWMEAVEKQNEGQKGQEIGPMQMGQTGSFIEEAEDKISLAI